MVNGTYQGSLIDQHLILGPHMKVVEKSLHKVILSSPHVHHGVGDNPHTMCIYTHKCIQIKQVFFFLLFKKYILIYTLLRKNGRPLDGSC